MGSGEGELHHNTHIVGLHAHHTARMVLLYLSFASAVLSQVFFSKPRGAWVLQVHRAHLHVNRAGDSGGAHMYSPMLGGNALSF